MVGLYHYLVLSGLLFTIGLTGVIFKRSAIIIFMSIELMLNGVNLSFIAFGRYLYSLDGQIFVFMVMVVAAVEVAVGLALIIALFRLKNTINVDEVNILKW